MNTNKPPKTIRDEAPYHTDRPNQPRRLPAVVQANVQALYDLGYRHWTDGATTGGHMCDPIYRMGWEAANVEYAESVAVERKREEEHGPRYIEPFTVARFQAEGIL